MTAVGCSGWWKFRVYSFFASRIGENLDEPSRKLMQRLVVLTDDLLHLGTAGRSQATVCMESVRFLVSSLLVLL